MEMVPKWYVEDRQWGNSTPGFFRHQSEDMNISNIYIYNLSRLQSLLPLRHATPASASAPRQALQYKYRKKIKKWTYDEIT